MTEVALDTAIRAIREELIARSLHPRLADIGVETLIDAIRAYDARTREMTKGELEYEIVRLRGLLARLEWAGQPVPGERIGTQPRCPVCRVTNPPHDRGCWLAAELDQIRRRR